MRTIYVREIHIKSFRHLEEVHLGPFILPPTGSDLVVLARPNGGGKSSILELLGYALSNSWSLGWSLRRSFPSNAFEVALAVTPEERALSKEYLALRLHAYPEEVRDYFDGASLSQLTSPASLEALVSQYQEEVRTAVAGDDDQWRLLFPVKKLLKEYAKSEGLGDPLVLQNSVIKEMSTSADLVPEELRDIINRIAKRRITIYLMLFLGNGGHAATSM